MTKLRPAAAPWSQAAKSGSFRHIDICLAIAQLAAGGIVARPDAGEAIADIEDAIPVVKLDPPVDAKLEELDGIDVLLDEVRVDGLGIAAMRINGEAPCRLVSRPRRP